MTIGGNWRFIKVLILIPIKSFYFFLIRLLKPSVKMTCSALGYIT